MTDNLGLSNVYSSVFSYRQKQTSLETIRAQIRQIEDEIAANRVQERWNGSPHGMVPRHMHTSYSTQSIPADLAGGSAGFRRRGPLLQRAHSVDVSVQSAISEIQSAVRHNSMIRLMTTPVCDKPLLEEEDENSIWVKRWVRGVFFRVRARCNRSQLVSGRDLG